MAHVIVAEGLCDRDFLHGASMAFDDFARFIERVDARSCRGDVRRRRGCDPRARPTVRDARARDDVHGLGLTEHVQGTDGVMALINLALLTGNIGKPGSGVNPLRGQNNVQGAAHMGCEPDLLPGSMPLDEGRPLFEQRWGSAAAQDARLELLEMMDAASSRAPQGALGDRL